MNCMVQKLFTLHYTVQLILYSSIFLLRIMPSILTLCDFQYYFLGRQGRACRCTVFETEMECNVNDQERAENDAESV